VVAERRVGERDQSLGRVRRIVTPGSARSGGALIAVRLGLALAVLSVLVGALPAVGDVIAPPPTASAYAYDSAAAVAHGAAESTPLAAVATAAVSGGSRAVRENSADFRGFGVAAETADAAATSVGKEVTTYYPTNRGFFGASTKQTLATGTRIDRYGGEGGFFASPEGTPAAMRALRPGTDLTNLHAYEVVSPLEVDAGTVAPWFGQLGLGTQYELPASVADLLDSGLLKAVE
jgi:Na+-transporting methylmalonyl-CoA/oxaloacetate decarboxylase gamma subunit